MMSFNLDNYTPVNERIIKFYELYPAGVITTQPAKTVIIGDKTFVSVMARVYLDRHMEDAPITEAEAWEPFPGTTSYTRDSEMMNCASSAIGRALGQLGIGIQAGVASADEVNQARQRQPESMYREHQTGKGKATPNQVKAVVSMAGKIGLTNQGDIATMLSEMLGRVLMTPNDLHFDEVTGIFEGKTERMRAAWDACNGKTTVNKTFVSEGDDIWGGENVG